MVSSMTGFGRAEYKNDGLEIVAEVRSVNNRFLDIQVKLPKSFYHLESELKTFVKKDVSRGRINIFINVNSCEEENTNGLKINHDSVRTYLNLIKKLKRSYNIGGKIQLDHLLSFSDIFTFEEDSQFHEKTWEAIKNTLSKALENFLMMRQKEGQELANDLMNRIQNLDNKVAEIEKLSKERHESDLMKLRERVKEIISEEDLNENRLETEIALMMNRMDVTEECVRFNSHNKMFLKSLQSDDTVGRKLNFLLQEMTREANTIGAKANHADISHLVVEIKEEVEKLREQVQNIE